MVYEMFKEILKSSSQNHFLYEYFDKDLIIESKNPISIKFKAEKDFDDLRSTYLEKSELLKKDPKKYFLKLFHYQINNNQEIFNWLNETYQIICIERTNLEHLTLSLLLGLYTNIWCIKTPKLYVEYNIDLKFYDFEIKKTDILNIRKSLDIYFENKKLIKNLTGVITYEEFVLKKEKILDDLNISKPNNFVYHPSFIKQHTDYYQCIRNKDQVKEWIQKYIINKSID